jgi:hypothetical protein
VIEIAIVTFAAVALHIEGAVFPVFFEVHKGAVVFSACSTLEIVTYFSPLHQTNYYSLIRDQAIKKSKKPIHNEAVKSSISEYTLIYVIDSSIVF